MWASRKVHSRQDILQIQKTHGAWCVQDMSRKWVYDRGVSENKGPQRTKIWLGNAIGGPGAVADMDPITLAMINFPFHVHADFLAQNPVN